MHGGHLDENQVYNHAASRMVKFGMEPATATFRFRTMELEKQQKLYAQPILRTVDSYYDLIEQTYSINDHALAKLTVTYTFGFGKKVRHGDEATQQSGVNSGILK